jgi:hypothetical protein
LIPQDVSPQDVSRFEEIMNVPAKVISVGDSAVQASRVCLLLIAHWVSLDGRLLLLRRLLGRLIAGSASASEAQGQETQSGSDGEKRPAK